MLRQDLLTGDEINNIDAIDRFGCTPLHTACISAAQATSTNDTKVLDSSLEFIMVLIDHGADLNVQSGEKYDYKVRITSNTSIDPFPCSIITFCHCHRITTGNISFFIDTVARYLVSQFAKRIRKRDVSIG